MKKSFSNFRRRVLGENNENLVLVAAFLVPILIMWTIYLVLAVYPFGNNSVLVLDLNGQYVYFFEELRNKLLHGGSLLYTWSRSLGGEFLGMFAYYLSSPFSIIVALFPKEHITEALKLMILLKAGSMGATMAYYLKKNFPNANKISYVIFSTMYALSAYAVVQAHNTMWIDNLILLPLVSLGIERIIRDGRFKLFVVSLAMALITNFYIGYMMCIYVAIYFFCCYIARSGRDDFNVRGEKGKFAISFARIVLYSLLAVSIAAIIILPAYTSLGFGKSTFSQTTWKFKQQFDFMELFAKFLPGSYDTVRPEGLPFVYCGVAALILVPFYFINSKIRTREKVAYTILSVFLIVSFNISALDIVWHGFQRPNWLNYRYSFMLIFVVLVMSFRAYLHIGKTNPKHVVLVTAGLCFAVMVIQKQNYKFTGDFACIWLSLACLIIYGFILGAEARGPFRRIACAVLCGVVCVEMFGAGLLNTVALDDDVVISSRDSYVNYFKDVYPVRDFIRDYDTSPFYRTEKTFHRKVNDPMTLGIYGISNSTSTLNSSVIELLHEMGYASKSHWTEYRGGTVVGDSLIGIKYIMSQDDYDNLSYEKIYSDENGYYVYKNPYALSLVYGVNPKVADIDITKYDSPFEFYNDLITAMTGSTERIELFKKLNVSDTVYYNMNVVGTVENCSKYEARDPSRDASVTYYVDIPEGVEALAFFPTDYPRECTLMVDGYGYGTCMGNDTDRIIGLGTYSNETQISVELEILDNTPFYITDDCHYFYYLDRDLCDEIFSELKKSDLEITKFSDTKIKGTISITENSGTLFTSIPYDSGWHVKIDGKTYKTSKALDSLLVIEGVEAGEHDITLTYMPKCFVVGALVSAAGIAVFATLVVLEKKRKKKAAVPIAGDTFDDCDPFGDDEYFDTEFREIPEDTADDPVDSDTPDDSSGKPNTETKDSE